MKKPARKESPKVGRIELIFVPTARLEQSLRFWTDALGGRVVKQWGGPERRSVLVEHNGAWIVLGEGPETDEQPELGIRIRHGAPVLHYATPDIQKLYRALANRGAAIVRGPLKTDWAPRC